MSGLQRILNSFLQGPIYVILFGFVFLAIGAGLSYHQYTLERSGLQAQGDVISLSSICDDDGCTYAPVVRFQSSDGRTVTFESSHSSNPPAYDVGEKVTVIYPVDKPEKAEIKGAGKVFWIIFTSVGGIIIIFGIVMFGKNLKDSVKTG
jgi:hypothetical protein